MSRIVPISKLVLVAGLFACTAEREPLSAPQQSFAMASAAPTSPNKLPAWTVVDGSSQNFASDGKGEYISGQCGVEGQIFYGNYDPATGIGGDATIENINPKRSACGPRSVKVTINGFARNVPAWNVMRVVGLSEGAPRDQNFGMAVDGVANCARLAWWRIEDGGAGGQITVTRTSSKTWTAVTSGNARCLYFKGQTRIWGASFTNIQVNLALRETP